MQTAKQLVKRVLPTSVIDRMNGVKMMLDYQRTIRRKQNMCHQPSQQLPGQAPTVTVCITNSNNRFPLELTLRTLLLTTSYPKLQILVADNNSVDSSVEMVQQLATKFPITLLQGTSRPQHEWYDYFWDTITTDYWVVIHEDMMFLANDWLLDLIAHMETHPHVSLLGGEYFPAAKDVVEPVAQKVVDMMESLSTWIFCVRTSTRSDFKSTFAFHSHVDSSTDRTIAYDLGGKLISELRMAGKCFECMPPAFLMKWQHLANITWSFKYKMSPGTRAFKLHQLADVKRRLGRIRATMENMR